MAVGAEKRQVNGRFVKVDFHVHTPVSKCYSVEGVTLDQIVEAAIKADLQAIAITDHNACEAALLMKEYAESNGLVVFPGIELSTQEGHVLALFETDMAPSLMEDLLEAVGIPQAAHGDGTVFTRSSMEEVLAEIDQRGGLAIAAHIERWPSGFLETKQSRKTKIRIHNSDHLSALEITQPENKDLWSEGKVRNYPKKYPCLQGSDAHSLLDIGRRLTYIKLERIDLANMRLAFQDHRSRIRFPQELP